jgi:ribosomal protein L19
MAKVNGLSISNMLSSFEASYSEFLLKDKQIENFRPGDKISVYLRSATSKRLSVVSGVCIAKSKRSLRSSFTLFKISDQVGVKLKYFFANPNIHSIKVDKPSKKYNRAKLNYIVRKSLQK